MPTNQRSSQMRDFAESKGLMTNARCLTEGVDLPAIDCVVFTDPKKSKVDIVQAAGRALRLSPGKRFGYILIPLIIPENENATEAAKDTAFEEIVATIRALATQDIRIIEYLRALSSGTIPKGGSPIDGITKINVLTKVNEEEFNKSIQLKVWDRVAFGNWRPYEEARKYAQSLKLKNYKEWLKHTKSENFPRDIPKKPDEYYKKEFKGYGDFLGTGTIAAHLRKYRSYEKAKKYAQSLKLKNYKEWNQHTKSKNFPKDIPLAPHHTYKKDFKSVGEFLGTGVIAVYLRKYRSYEQAKKYAQSLKLKNQKEWNLHAKSENFPKDIPSNPHQTYKKEFKGMGEFLGTGTIAPFLRKYRSYEQAKKYAQSLKLKSVKGWKQHTKSKNFPKDIPVNPYNTYKKEFKGMGEFLGTGTIAPFLRKYRSYDKAKKYAQSLKLKSRKEWVEHTKSKNFPKDIPAYPNNTYKKEFKSVGDFLGTGFIAPQLRKFRSYDKAKKYAQSLKLKSQKEWKQHTKSENFPKDIPVNPNQTYKKEFEGYSLFLDTGRKYRGRKS